MTSTNGGLTTRIVSSDQVFTALSHTARRRVLSALVSAAPRDEVEFESVEYAPEDQRPGSFAIELHHTHLPHLDDAGFVDWERESGTVDRGPAFEEIRPLLELLDEHRRELPAGWP